MSSYLGQNFLTDGVLLQRIANEVKRLFEDTQSQCLIEIGPGKGALTKQIQDLSKQTLLIEYDQHMVEYLQIRKILSHHTLLVQSDILQREPDGLLSSQTLVVGNLPYYITSPILRKFFETQTPTRAGGVFLIQKEVADKVKVDAPKKSFLWWLINYAYQVDYCFAVPAKAFTPPPKVTSAVIRLTPKQPQDIPQIDYQRLITFLDLYSPYKRKTLGSSSKLIAKRLSKTSSSDTFDFDVSKYQDKRLEELGWQEMEEIVKG